MILKNITKTRVWTLGFLEYERAIWNSLHLETGLSNSVAVVQSLSHVWLFATPWTTAHQASLSLTISWSSPMFMSMESVMPSNHLILCCPLLLPSIFPSNRIFSNELTICTRWPKYWNFSISPSNEYSGLISLRVDWFDPLVFQGTLKNLLQHNSKASIFYCSAFLMVQLSHLYTMLLLLLLLSRFSCVWLCATP